MHFLTSLLALAALSPIPILAQRLQFSSVPGPFTIGRPSVLTWSGSSSSASVTLTLRKGNPSNLDTIGIIASNIRATNNYTWTPASNLTPADDYALQITQGLDEINYSGQFSILAAESGSATTIIAVGNGTTSVVATITPNVTSSASMMGSGGSGMATGTAMGRNSTMASPTLSGSATLTSSNSGSRSAGATSTGAAAAPFGGVQAGQVVGVGAAALGAAAVLLF